MGVSSGWFVSVIMSPAAVIIAGRYWCGIVVNITCTSSVQLPHVTLVIVGETRRAIWMDCKLQTSVLVWLQTCFFFLFLTLLITIFYFTQMQFSGEFYIDVKAVLKCFCRIAVLRIS